MKYCAIRSVSVARWRFKTGIQHGPLQSVGAVMILRKCQTHVSGLFQVPPGLSILSLIALTSMPVCFGLWFPFLILTPASDELDDDSMFCEELEDSGKLSRCASTRVMLGATCVSYWPACHLVLPCGSEQPSYHQLPSSSSSHNKRYRWSLNDLVRILILVNRSLYRAKLAIIIATSFIISWKVLKGLLFSIVFTYASYPTRIKTEDVSIIVCGPPSSFAVPAWT